jgi:hypothetical protein
VGKTKWGQTMFTLSYWSLIGGGLKTSLLNRRFLSYMTVLDCVKTVKFNANKILAVGRGVLRAS